MAETLNLVTFPIPGHVESSERGTFIDLTKAIAQKSNITITISVEPPPRAINNFFEGKYNAIFPALNSFYSKNAVIVRTMETMDCKEDFAFVRSGRPAISKLNELKGLTVGLTKGYPYAESITKSQDYRISYALSDEINLKMLAAGRIDAFILDEKTGAQASARLNLANKVQFDKHHPISRMEVFYAFQNSPRGKDLAGKFSAALTAMKKSGEYKRISKGITLGGACINPANSKTH
ncbi:transporter substrate-binding domain-containing protein [Neisseriaceae bacterium TC5R-5]|nr:transporter substrate-binding domain-containing protein [Neisseriaceae bacterium TC5R-5]